jgi:hypothetical protein
VIEAAPHGRGSPKPCPKSQGDKERYHRTAVMQLQVAPVAWHSTVTARAPATAAPAFATRVTSAIVSAPATNAASELNPAVRACAARVAHVASQSTAAARAPVTPRQNHYAQDIFFQHRYVGNVTFCTFQDYPTTYPIRKAKHWYGIH